MSISAPEGPERSVHRRGRWPGGRARRVALALCAAMTMGAAVGITGLVGVAGGPTAASAATAVNCTFGPHALTQLVLNVKAGEQITIDCTGLPATTPFLLIETSLLVAVDPAAEPLLTGSVTSAPGILALVSALPEMNALSESIVDSDSSGVLDTTYTVPTSQPTDPNATCPPSTEQFNSGIIGCAVAMIDLTSGSPVTAGTALLSYASTGLFPPDGTLALSPNPVTEGKTVTISDAPNAKTYWWVATLASLYSALGGGKAGPVPVTITSGGRKVKGSGEVTPASYSDETFTPPKLAGSFIAAGHGKKKIDVSLSVNLLGFGLGNSQDQKLTVVKPTAVAGARSAARHRR